MDFGFNDEQREIKQTARAFCADRFKPEVVRNLAEAERYDDDLWTQMVELGWPGIAIDERFGGQGLGLIELVLLAEELGYACAPSPFLAQALSALALQVAGSQALQERYLPGLASASSRGAVGTDELCIDPEGADLLVLFSDDQARAVEAADAEVQGLLTIDQTRRYGVVGPAGEPLGGETEAIAGARDRIAVAIAADSLGLAQRALDMSVAYAAERRQFERPIGAYQGVSHRCAEMLWAVEEARSLVYYAAWAADSEPASLPLAAAMAKARASDAAWEVCKDAVQVHGGIGFTWEHDLHFLLKRARANTQLFGGGARHRERVAELVGL